MNAAQPARKKSAVWRWIKRVLLGLGVLVFIFVFLVVPFWLSWMLTHAGSRPSDRVMNVTP